MILNQKSLNQKGAVPLVIALAVLVLGVLITAGYFVVTNHTKKKDATQSQAVPNTIESKSDLEQTSKALDSGNLDSDLDPAALDEDLNDLL